MKPNTAAIGRVCDSNIAGCVTYLDAVSFSTCIAVWDALYIADCVCSSTIRQSTSIHPLYDRYAKPKMNNPMMIAAILATTLTALPAKYPSNKPPPAEKRKCSTGNSQIYTPFQLRYAVFFEVMNLISNRHFYVRFILYQSTDLYAIPYVRIRQLLPYGNCNFICCVFVNSFS
jgi:hypothetical protein